MKVPSALGPFALLVLALPLACVGHQKINAQPRWFGGPTSGADGAKDPPAEQLQKGQNAQMQKEMVELTKSINEYEWKHVDIMQRFSDSVMKSQEETLPLEDKRRELQQQLHEFATKNEDAQKEMEGYEATSTERLHAMHEESRELKERLYTCIDNMNKKWASKKMPFWITTTEPVGMAEAEEGSMEAEEEAEDGKDEQSDSSEEQSDSSEEDEQSEKAAAPHAASVKDGQDEEAEEGPVPGTWGMPMGYPGIPHKPRQKKLAHPTTTPLIASTTDPVPVQGVRPDVLKKVSEDGAVAHQKSWEGEEAAPHGCGSMGELAGKLQRAIEKYTRSKEQLIKDHAAQVKRKSLLVLEGKAVDEVIEKLRTDIGALEAEGSSTS